MAHADPDPCLTFVTERDIDLLLVEELNCSPEFTRWFWSKITQKPATLQTCEIKVAHSVSTLGEGAGESDITVDITDMEQGRRTRTQFLIENKIDARFQPT